MHASILKKFNGFLINTDSSTKEKHHHYSSEIAINSE